MPKDVSVLEAAELVDSGAAVLLDVREPDEWHEVRAPVALHIPMRELTDTRDVCADALASPDNTRIACDAGDDLVIATGSSQRHAVLRRPFASAAFDGITTRNPGMWVKIPSMLWLW